MLEKFARFPKEKTQPRQEPRSFLAPDFRRVTSSNLLLLSRAVHEISLASLPSSTIAMSLPPSSPRLPSPPPPTEIQIGPKSPALGSFSNQEPTTIDQGVLDANASRRIHPGTKSGDMAAGPPLIPLSEVDIPCPAVSSCNADGCSLIPPSSFKSTSKHYTTATRSLSTVTTQAL
jgi:hypothetical protein